MTKVKDVMTRDPVYVSSNSIVTKARSIIRDYGYRALPVVDNGYLVGMVSRGDILRVTSSKTNVTVKGVMSDSVVTTSPNDDLFSTAKSLIDAGVRQLPVIQDNKLVGIISAMDILSSFVDHDYNPVKKSVGDVMVTDVISCKPDDEVSKIWNSMYKKSLSGLPVLKTGEVIGIVTSLDLMKGSVRISKESGKTRTAKVSKVMKTPALTTRPESSIINAAEFMVTKGVSRLPVVDEKKKLVGIVDVEDILRAYVS